MTTQNIPTTVTQRKGDWIETYTGKKFWPLDPRPEDVCIEDIAHALSLICRFNGHCKHFYSVAHHSVLCCKLASLKGHGPRIRLLALLHDAAEAYVTDIPRPIKGYIEGYKDIENRVQVAILGALGIDLPTKKEKMDVKILDRIMLSTEGKQIMPFDGWGNMLYPPHDEIKITTARPQLTKNEFLNKYRMNIRNGAWSNKGKGGDVDEMV